MKSAASLAVMACLLVCASTAAAEDHGLSSSSWLPARQTRPPALPNLGAGLNVRLPQRRGYKPGLKVEFRGYVRGGRESVNYGELRVGVVLWE